jgi:DNA-binding SARP family transcriptional activator
MEFERFLNSNAKPLIGLRLLGLGNPRVLVDGVDVAFLTVHAAKALFSLALAPEYELDVMDLGSRLWPDAPTSVLHRRVATAIWQMRLALGDEAWRIQRSRDAIRITMDGVESDIAAARTAAAEWLAKQPVDGVAVGELIDALNQEVLAPWSTEPWVVVQQAVHTGLSEALVALQRHA